MACFTHERTFESEREQLKPLKIRSEDGPHGEIILDVEGEMDYHNAHHLYNHILDLVEAGARCVRLNTHGLGYFDGSGMTQVVRAHKRLEVMDGKLVIGTRSSHVKKVLHLLGLDGIFPAPVAA